MSSSETYGHTSVLLKEAIEGLALRSDGVYVDATFGAGGHSRAILGSLDTMGRLIAFDVDPTVVPIVDPRFSFVSANFGELADSLADLGIERIDGILFDFGVSSMQFDQGERGFSFQVDAPLDMRMNRSDGQTAYDLLATLEENDIANVIYEYGEERASRKIARALVRMRDEGRLPSTTLELARCVSGVVHMRGKRERVHPATRTFQALRIAVNDELRNIERGLDAAIATLAEGGRIAAISFHSLEDRIVKHRFREDPRLDVITRKPLSASEEELAANPRSRSAHLRVAARRAA